MQWKHDIKYSSAEKRNAGDGNVSKAMRKVCDREKWRSRGTKQQHDWKKKV